MLEQGRKKIVSAIIMVIVSVIMLTGTTLAYFSDVVNVIQSISTGTYTFDLYYKDHVSGNWLKADENDETYEFIITDFYPGSEKTFNFYVANTGSLRIDDAVISIETEAPGDPSIASQILYSWDSGEYYYKNTLEENVPIKYLGDIQPEQSEYFNLNLQFVNGSAETEKYGFNADQSEYIGKTAVVKVRVSSKSRPTKAVSSYEKPYAIEYLIGEDKYYLGYSNDGKVIAPIAPVDGALTFNGWYTDAGLTIPFDFEEAEISSDIVLYGGWN
jgi:predicted ribosomally synthesized peptide with SipW-like signal peptide